MTQVQPYACPTHGASFWRPCMAANPNLVPDSIVEALVKNSGGDVIKKKVIALVVDTGLTNAQLEAKGAIQLTVFDPDNDGTQHGVLLKARNVRILDVDED